MKPQIKKYTSFESLKSGTYELPVHRMAEKELENFVLLLRKSKMKLRYPYLLKAQKRYYGKRISQ